jgi:hypothetical protein
MTRMKTIALIDTRLEVPGVSLGILVSTHPDAMAAFAANDAFQKAEASGRHIRTKIVTLKDRVDVGQPAHLAESNEPIPIRRDWAGWIAGVIEPRRCRLFLCQMSLHGCF